MKMQTDVFFAARRRTRPLLYRSFRRGSAMVALCLLGACGIKPAQALPVARIRNMKPVVQVRSKGTVDFVMAHDRNTLRFGDTVRTLAGGKADLIFANGTQIALRENTQIEIVAPETETKPLVVRVFGALSEVFVRPKGNTQIQTAAAIAAARGTEYLVSLPSENKTVVTVTEGSVDFFNKQGRVLVAVNQQSTASVGDAPTPPVATDVSGLVTWMADITGLPVEFDLREALSPDLEGGAAGPFIVRAQAFLRLGRPEPALTQLGLASSNNPGVHEQGLILVCTGRAREQQGDIAAAIAAYRSAIALAPSREASEHLALALLSTRDFDGARAALPTPADAVSTSISGLVSLHEGKPEVAETELRAALVNDPQYAQAEALLALALLTQNRVIDAGVSARRAALLAPNSAQVQGTLATVLFFSGDNRQAGDAVTRAVALNPESPFALLAEGRICMARLQTAQARNALGQAQALAPDLPVIPSELGAVYLKLDMLPKADKAYRRAIELSPDFVDAHTGLAQVLQAEGNPAGAENEYRVALKIDPKNADALGGLASLFIEQGRLADAESILKQAVAISPERGVLYVRLSEISLLHNDLFAAQGFARRAVELLPDSAVAHYQLGRTYLEQERNAQAEQEFRQAVALDGRLAKARYALGYTEDLVDEGTDRSGNGLNGPDSLGAAAAALDLNNIQSAGAAERIKAAIADPSVIRVATRSYGDTEIDGAIGTENSNDFTLSHIQQTDGNRGVIGVTGEYHRNQGALPNSSLFDQQGSIIFGQKAHDNPSSIFFLGQTQQVNDGLDFVGDAASSLGKRTVHKSSFILGGNLQADERSSTRALIQYSDPSASTGNLGFIALPPPPALPFAAVGATSNANLRSFNGEIRHDVQLDEKNALVAGLFAGSRNLNSSDVIPFGPATTTINSDHLYGGYIRDDVRLNERLRFSGEVRVQHVKQNIGTSLDLGAGPMPLPIALMDRTDVLPNLVLEYQAGRRTGFRLRARRLGGTYQDFQLLAPTDPFFTTTDSLPVVGLNFGYGTSVEVEADHSFVNSSFLRAGLIFQTLHNALEPNIGGGGNNINNVSVSGFQTGFDGSLSENTTYFVNLNLQHVEDTDLHQQVAESPSFIGQAGVQYLDRRGLFVRPIYIYSSSRMPVSIHGVSTRQGGLGLFNVRVGKRAGVRSEIFVEVLNAFDKQYEMYGFDESGREFRVGAMQRF